jgi:hypothetical protein
VPHRSRLLSQQLFNQPRHLTPALSFFAQRF